MTARTKIFTMKNLGEKCLRKEKLEAIEVRIDMLRQDSRLISYRISALEERRHEIQERIKKLKQRAKRAR